MRPMLVEQRNRIMKPAPFFEPELLGSAGTLAANRAWVEGEEMFLACNADNLTDFDLQSLVQTHRKPRRISLEARYTRTTK